MRVLPGSRICTDLFSGSIVCRQTITREVCLIIFVFLFYKFTNLQLLNVSPVFIGPPCGHCIKHIALFENFLYHAVHAWDRCRMNGQAMQYSSLNKTVRALSIEALT